MAVTCIQAHISGPSSVAVDTHYRAIAAAYSTFEPVSHLALSIPLTAVCQPTSSTEQRTSSPLLDPALAPPEPVYIHDTPHAIAALQTQLTSPSLLTSSSCTAHPAKRRRIDVSSPCYDADIISDIDPFPPLLPPVSRTETRSSPFSPHTAFLTQLLRKQSLSGKCVLPAHRDLVPLERGHWRFDISSFPPELRTSFWHMLARIVGDGRAGFVSCWYDDGIVKIYCWGEVLRAVYLLLYVASKSWITRVEASWIDADGKEMLIYRTNGIGIAR